jgi:hypothetical protein
MNTSGLADPPEICVARVARLVSVFVGAEIRLTLIFGFCFSNAWIRTWRTSVPLVVIGLADHEIVPVAAPLADAVALLPPVVELLLLPLLLQPARASAPVTPTTAVRCQPRTGRLIDRSRTTCLHFSNCTVTLRNISAGPP